ncbi:hypothetical protein CIB48_g6874 [Xylaria polymorpha]|nr:hypothetical protein CIB48_g6874 [Xylaria polymorpha]
MIADAQPPAPASVKSAKMAPPSRRGPREDTLDAPSIVSSFVRSYAQSQLPGSAPRGKRSTQSDPTEAQKAGEGCDSPKQLRLRRRGNPGSSSSHDCRGRMHRSYRIYHANSYLQIRVSVIEIFTKYLKHYVIETANTDIPRLLKWAILVFARLESTDKRI